MQGESIKILMTSAEKNLHLRFTYLAATSLLSTALGAFLAYKISNLSHRKRVKSESVKLFIELIGKFETQCLEYWSKDHDGSCNLVDEAKIKAGHKLLRQYAEHGKFNLTVANKEKLNRQISLLFDAATGGDFESSARKASRQKMQKVAMITADIMPLLIENSFD